MGTITAKQLKQKTGEVMRRIRSGERLTVTYRGETVAVITPSVQEQRKKSEDLRPFEEAWRGIEAALKETKPEFQGWREATEWVRKRR
ncbi:MAG: type II toxin-antitoxin system prevent-host-death family antitoxin [Deltaproteobacteria bacterium]|jgi:prevent-host-death family protein|nr:type II toxin-antitoxin system prevent-host-death family antitoxin [Deltaproteobacteria bacterium]MBW2205032.1 type II toxin-antitoxin system prevent-host-death family antitoxin [Deltaproteobacteria bacterium]